MVFAFAGDSTMTRLFSHRDSRNTLARPTKSYESAAVHALNGAGEFQFEKTLKKRDAIHPGEPGELVQIVGLGDGHVEEDWILRRWIRRIGSLQAPHPDLYFLQNIVRALDDPWRRRAAARARRNCGR